MVNWDATPFIEDCMPGFLEVTRNFMGFDDCERRTRLRAYARWGFEHVAGRERWTNRIEQEMISLIDREMYNDAMFLEYWEGVTAFASYVFGALAAKQDLGQLDHSQVVIAHIQLATYDHLNMEEIHDLYEKAKYGEEDD